MRNHISTMSSNIPGGKKIQFLYTDPTYFSRSITIASVRRRGVRLEAPVWSRGAQHMSLALMAPSSPCDSVSESLFFRRPRHPLKGTRIISVSFRAGTADRNSKRASLTPQAGQRACCGPEWSCTARRGGYGAGFQRRGGAGEQRTSTAHLGGGIGRRQRIAPTPQTPCHPPSLRRLPACTP